MMDRIFTFTLAVIVLVVLLLGVFGCAQYGFIKVHRIDEQDGRKTTQTTEVRQPTGAIVPATLAMGDVAATQPSITASTGAGQQIDQALAQLSGLPMIGVGLMVLGVVLLVAKAWFPLFPLELGIGLIALGFVVVMLPTIIDRYAWALGLGLAAVGFYSWNVWRQNKAEYALKEKVGVE